MPRVRLLSCEIEFETILFLSRMLTWVLSEFHRAHQLDVDDDDYHNECTEDEDTDTELPSSDDDPASQ